MRRRIFAFIALTQVLFLVIVSGTVAFAINLQSTQTAQSNIAEVGVTNSSFIAIGAGLAMGLAAIGSGYAIASSGTAAISALVEKPETFFRSFLVVALAEAISIYGLIIGILLWLKI